MLRRPIEVTAQSRHSEFSDILTGHKLARATFLRFCAVRNEGIGINANNAKYGNRHHASGTTTPTELTIAQKLGTENLV